MHAVMQYSPQIESTWLNLTAWKSDLDVIESDKMKMNRALGHLCAHIG